MVVRNFIYALTRIRFDYLKSYTEEMEYNIVRNIESFKNRTDEETSGYSDDELEYYWDYHIDEFYEIKSVYPSILRYTIVVSVISTLEQTLVRIFNTEFKRNPYSRHFKTYHENTFIALSEYFKHEMKICIPKYNPEWKFILNLNKIRNNIVHNNGRVYDDNNKLLLNKIIKNTPHITISDSEEIIIEKEFTDLMIDTILKFLKELFYEIKYKRVS